MAMGKLAALSGVYKFDILEYPVPRAMEGSLVIKTEAAAICGSDLHGIRSGTEKPKNIGHEFTGKVVELGPKANEMIHCYGGELKVGDRIAVYPHITCGKCDTCMTYGPGVCIMCDDSFVYGGGPFTSSGVLNTDPEKAPHFKGGFGEYVHIFPGTFVWKVPDDMPVAIASLLDPVAVAVRAIELATTEVGVLQEGITTTTRALVIGPGPIGIITAMILRYMGVEQLIISGRHKKLEMAQEISRAHDVLNVDGLSTDERVKKLLAMTDGGANLVINCANHPSAQIEGLQMVRKLGTYIEVGLPFSFGPGNEVLVDLPKLIFEKNARITSVVANTPSTFDRAFRLLKKHKELPFKRLITHEFHSLEDLLPTMKKMTDGDYLKGVLIFD
jgi:threonine dehydrogenase-like Zn-dependent dehydrogenase